MTDARTQSPAEQQKRRLEVVRFDDEGVGVMEMVRRTGLSWGAVRRTLDRYRTEGVSGLQPRTRGRRAGSGALNAEQQQDLCDAIRKRPPWYYGLGDALWNKAAVQALIRKRFDMTLTSRGVGNYLMAWGLSVSGSPRDRCSHAVQQWLDGHYADLHAQWSVDGAQIYWLNGRKALPRTPWGEGAAASATGRTTARLMISAVSNQGKLVWRVIDGPFNERRKLQFLRALAKDRGTGKTVVIANDERQFAAPMWSSGLRQSGLAIDLVPPRTV